MKKIGIFYGSTTGVTEAISEKMADRLNIAALDVHNVADTAVNAIENYDVLLLGSSTWGVGELQDDWHSFLNKLKKENLTGKSVALFGCGDSVSFGGSFCDAIGIIYHELEGSGCKFIGAIGSEGYSFDASEAYVDGKFVGLPIDESNEPDDTDQRIDFWLDSMKMELE